jgi:hypothetical protein
MDYVYDKDAPDHLYDDDITNVVYINTEEENAIEKLVKENPDVNYAYSHEGMEKKYRDEIDKKLAVGWKELKVSKELWELLRDKQAYE